MLVAALAARVAERFGRPRWPMTTGRRRAPARFQSLEAVQAIEEGLNAYDAAEYAEARDAFASAAREDPRHPLPVTWQSRLAQITGDRTCRRSRPRIARPKPAAGRERRPTRCSWRRWWRRRAARTSAGQPLRRHWPRPQRPDDPAAVVELAGFQDRSGQTRPRHRVVSPLP